MTDAEAGKNDNGSIRVLVTGATGYLAIHCIQQLLNEGYQVKGTVRDVNNTSAISPLKELKGSDRLQLISANLNDKNTWPEAVKDCDYVLHIASPCPTIPDESIINTAVEGTLNVLKACSGCYRIKKMGHEDRRLVYKEDSWTITDGSGKFVMKYHLSKTLAERAAWDFVQKEPGVKFKLTVLNPTLIVGPLLQNTKGASATIISRFLDGSMLAVPPFKLGIVDVDDVALAHIRAMRNPETDNQRILINAYTMSFPWVRAPDAANSSSPQHQLIISRFLDGSMIAVPPFKLGVVDVDDVALAHIRAMRNPYTDNQRILINAYTMSFREIAQVLCNEFAPQGYPVPRAKAPMMAVKLYSLFDKESREMAKLGKYKEYFDNSKARRLLGIEFKDPQESLIDMCYDMIDRGILPRRRKHRAMFTK